MNKIAAIASMTTAICAAVAAALGSTPCIFIAATFYFVGIFFILVGD